MAKLICQQIILPRGRYYVSQNQLTAIESWLMRFSGGHHIAWMDFKQRCGTIPLRKVPIQMKIKSLNGSSCPWIFAFSSIARDENVCRICFKDKILSRVMFILGALALRGVPLHYCFSTVSWQFSTSLPLSISINQADFYKVNLRRHSLWVFYRHQLCTHTHPHTPSLAQSVCVCSKKTFTLCETLEEITATANSQNDSYRSPMRLKTLSSSTNPKNGS